MMFRYNYCYGHFSIKINILHSYWGVVDKNFAVVFYFISNLLSYFMTKVGSNFDFQAVFD